MVTKNPILERAIDWLLAHGNQEGADLLETLHGITVREAGASYEEPAATYILYDDKNTVLASVEFTANNVAEEGHTLRSAEATWLDAIRTEGFSGSVARVIMEIVHGPQPQLQ